MGTNDEKGTNIVICMNKVQMPSNEQMMGMR